MQEESGMVKNKIHFAGLQHAATNCRIPQKPGMFLSLPTPVAPGATLGQPPLLQKERHLGADVLSRISSNSLSALLPRRLVPRHLDQHCTEEPVAVRDGSRE